jgi:hypothetical protein
MDFTLGNRKSHAVSGAQNGAGGLFPGGELEFGQNWIPSFHAEIRSIF